MFNNIKPRIYYIWRHRLLVNRIEQLLQVHQPRHIDTRAGHLMSDLGSELASRANGQKDRLRAYKYMGFMTQIVHNPGDALLCVVGIGAVHH